MAIKRVLLPIHDDGSFESLAFGLVHSVDRRVLADLPGLHEAGEDTLPRRASAGPGDGIPPDLAIEFK